MNQSIHYLIMFSFLYASLKIDKPKIHRKKKERKKNWLTSILPPNHLHKKQSRNKADYSLSSHLSTIVISFSSQKLMVNLFPRELLTISR